jgi:rhomboid protease GluP
MDFTSIVLIQIAVFSCLATLLPTSRSNTSHKFAAIFILAILGWSWYFAPQQAVRIGMVAWVGLLLLPMYLMYRLESLVNNSQYLAASRLAKGLRWLLPTDGMWTYHHLLQGIALANMGQLEAADAIFDRYQSDDRTELSRSATALLYRSTDRWHEYVRWVKQRLILVRRMTLARIDRALPEKKLGQGMTLVYYVRALAEIGDLHSCIQELSNLERDRQINLQQLNLVRMYILAFCGRVDAVTQVCERILSMYPETVHQFWMSTAELAQGNVDRATKQLARLQEQTHDRSIQADIAWRLSQPLPDLDKLTPEDWQILGRLEAQTLQEVKYGAQTPADVATPATNLIIWVNVLVFCAELFWQYRSGNPKANFIEWGGLVAPLVIQGEWWRIGTANFLHLNFLHLGMNMLALIYLGKFVEYRLGTFRFMLAYLLAGIGSMAMVTYIDTRWMTDPHVTVGASGAIMGLLGTMGAIHLTGWRRGKASSAARQFQAVLFSVGFQLIFDITNGQTSIVGHFSGLLFGFVVGLGLLLFSNRE